MKHEYIDDLIALGLPARAIFEVVTADRGWGLISPSLTLDNNHPNIPEAHNIRSAGAALSASGTVLSPQTIAALGIVWPCVRRGTDSQGNSYGLGPCTYDVRLGQDVTLHPGEFVLASTLEWFKLPNNVCMGIKDKSSLIRRKLKVQNTHADPGWFGFLTLELEYHPTGEGPLNFKRGDAIAQVKFEFLDRPTDQPYTGKYQNQEDGPQEARKDKIL